LPQKIAAENCRRKLPQKLPQKMKVISHDLDGLVRIAFRLSSCAPSQASASAAKPVMNGRHRLIQRRGLVIAHYDRSL
jgi:hypothetical protein